ncbi:hypothetical protein GOV11_05395 [Candidatus Woesearchaeota archaeon]|nr:hypothetical protein [Candidatus Woesearchaeota archaeon]
MRWGKLLIGTMVAGTLLGAASAAGAETRKHPYNESITYQVPDSVFYQSVLATVGYYESGKNLTYAEIMDFIGAQPDDALLEYYDNRAVLKVRDDVEISSQIYNGNGNCVYVNIPTKLARDSWETFSQSGLSLEEFLEKN